MGKYTVYQGLHRKIIEAYFKWNEHKDILGDWLKTNWQLVLKDYSEGEILAPDKLEGLLGVCEKRLKELISRHSAYVLLFWSRRLAPENIFNVAPESVRLYRDIMTLAIYKYGRQTDPEPVGETVMPSSLSPYLVNMNDRSMKPESVYTWHAVVDELDATIETECVAYIYTRLTQIYRWAGKGATVTRKGSELTVDASEELQQTVELYDRRLRDANLLSTMGDRFINKSTKLKHAIALPHLNTDRGKVTKDIVVDEDKHITEIKMMGPNFLYSYLNLKKFGQHIEKYSAEIHKAYGFTPKEFITFLHAIDMEIILPAHTSVHQCRDLNYCAYIVRRTESDDPTGELTELLWTGNVEKQITKERLRAVTEYFMSRADKGNPDLNLWTRQPKKLIYQLSPHWWVFDLSHLVYPIHDVMKCVAALNGSTATVRGESFEESVVEALKSIYGNGSLWVCRQHIQGKGNEDEEKEIDASVVIKNTLFVIEAKAMTVPEDFDCGKPNTLKNRRNTLRKYLKQANAKAEFICEHKDELHKPKKEGGAPIRLPGNVRRICPVLVTAFPEYIWDLNPNKFLDTQKKIPRILTIDELPLLKRLKTAELETFDFVGKIER